MFEYVISYRCYF